MEARITKFGTYVSNLPKFLHDQGEVMNFDRFDLA